MKNSDLFLWGVPILIGAAGLWFLNRPKNNVNGYATNTGTKDKWGLTQLHPSVGREWFSNWYTPRSWASKGFGHEVESRDPQDAQTFLYCPKADAGYPNSASAADGILTLNGASLRFLVKKPGSTWKNVEITTYIRKVGKYGTGHTDAVMNISGPSTHDLAYLCRMTGYAYYANIGSSGKEELLKELLHISNPTGGPDGYSLQKYGVTSHPFSAGFPTSRWIGYKLLVQNSNGDKYRRVRFYRDLTDGLNGGDWKLIADTTDTGSWGVSQSVWDMGDASSSNCKKSGMIKNTSRNRVLNFASNSIQFRVYHNTTKLKKTSVREINPLP